jgi:hypothetical protein
MNIAQNLALTKTLMNPMIAIFITQGSAHDVTGNVIHSIFLHQSLQRLRFTLNYEENYST